MGLFQGEAPPNVETFRETAQKAPDYLTNYLSQLATSGIGSIGTMTGTGDAAKFTPYTGEELVAGLGDLEKTAIEGAPGALSRYQTPLDAALTSGQAAAGGIVQYPLFFENGKESANISTVIGGDFTTYTQEQLLSFELNENTTGNPLSFNIYRDDELYLIIYQDA